MTSNPYSLNLSPGDIVDFYNAQAGKPKHHLCLLPYAKDFAARMMFINSKNTSLQDAVLTNSCFPCIPPTIDGVSVVSFSAIIPMAPRQLQTFGATVIGRIDPSVARTLEAHLRSLTRPALTSDEIRLVFFALSKI